MRMSECVTLVTFSSVNRRSAFFAFNVTRFEFVEISIFIRPYLLAIQFQIGRNHHTVLESTGVSGGE